MDTYDLVPGDIVSGTRVCAVNGADRAQIILVIYSMYCPLPLHAFALSVSHMLSISFSDSSLRSLLLRIKSHCAVTRPQDEQTLVPCDMLLLQGCV